MFNVSFIIVETDQTLEKEIIYSEPTFIERNAHNTVRSFIPKLCCTSLYKFSRQSNVCMLVQYHDTKENTIAPSKINKSQ